MSESIELLQATRDRFGGMIIDSAALPRSPTRLHEQLAHSLSVWQSQGAKLAWLQIPIAQSALISPATELGFVFHHCDEHYLMLHYPLIEGAFVPNYATHFIGAGGVVINEKQELLVVSERHRRDMSRPYYKLPGGGVNQREHIAAAIEREVHEETGIEAKFEAVVCFRQWHGYRYGKSDIYVICRLSPLTEEITIQESEIDECLWMPIEEYLNSDYVAQYNRQIVRAALNSPGLESIWLDEYSDPTMREFFMPNLTESSENEIFC